MSVIIDTTRHDTTRHYYFDFLRIISAFAVMMLHLASIGYYNSDVNSFEWKIFNFYHGGLTYWSVPVFVMISGSLFLSRDISAKKMFSKYIFRMILAFVFWSSFYALLLSYLRQQNIADFLSNFIIGHYHLWFLFMITGLYMIVPFMKKIAESEQLTKYFLILALFSAFVIPQSISLCRIFSKQYDYVLGKAFGNFYLSFAAGFSGYFLAGYFLNTHKITLKHECLIYIAGAAGILISVFLSEYASLNSNMPVQTFCLPLSIGIMAESIAIFTFCKKHVHQKLAKSGFIRALSKYSFGAYLVHAAVIGILKKIPIVHNMLMSNPLVFLPLTALIVFIISFSISALLNHIPVINRYIV